MPYFSHFRTHPFNLLQFCNRNSSARTTRSRLATIKFFLQKAYCSTMQLQCIWPWIVSSLCCSQTLSLHAGREKILCDYRPRTSHVRVRKSWITHRLDNAVNWHLFRNSQSDIRHVPSEDNPVADGLSRVDSVMMPVIVDTEELAQQQATDEELLLLELKSSSSSLKLQMFLLPETNSSLYCDCSQNNVRPFVPSDFTSTHFRHGIWLVISEWKSYQTTNRTKICLDKYEQRYNSLGQSMFSLPTIKCHTIQSPNSRETPDSRHSFWPRSFRSNWIIFTLAWIPILFDINRLFFCLVFLRQYR